MVEIKDTIDDRKKYSEIMFDYINYINENYFSVDVNKIDIEKCFYKEIIKNCDKKLPLFFAYINDTIIGTVGVRGYYKINHFGHEYVFQDFSVRLTNLKRKNGLSVLLLRTMFTCYLYLLNQKDTVLFFDAFNKTSETFFHLVQEGWFAFQYCGVKNIKESFFSNANKVHFYFDSSIELDLAKSLIDICLKTRDE